MITKAVSAAIATGLLASCAATSTPRSSGTTRPTPTPSIVASASPTATATPSASTSPAPSTPRPSTPTPTAGGLPQWLRGDVVTHLSTTRHIVALTFDGGSGSQGATAVLATLSAAHIRATFFLTGDFVSRYPLVVAVIVRGGHVVGNHTMTHARLPSLSTATAQREITDAAARLQAMAGVRPRPWFRFPYGAYDARSLGLVHALGYGAIGWSVDTLGWKGREAGTPADVVDRVLRGLRPGEIVLMHLGANPDDGTTYDAAALPDVIAAIRAAGYELVPLTVSVPTGTLGTGEVPAR